MRKLTFCLIFLLIIYVPGVFASSGPTSTLSDLNAKAVLLVNVSDGRILFSHNPDKQLYPASTTKIMTAILALEKGKPEQVMTASSEAVYDIGPDGMHVGIKPGDEYTLDVLLNAMLVRSANEAANIIAENICTSRKEFINLMNTRAKELGCKNTNFTNTNGMHHDNHYSSALDLSIIARHALTLPGFKEIVSQKYYYMPLCGKPDENIYLPSTNELLKETFDNFSYVTGIKTGYTDPAGFNLVASAIDESGLELLTVVLGAETRDESFSISKELLEYGYRNFAVQTIAEIHESVTTINIPDAAGDPELEAITSSQINALMPKDKGLWEVEKEVIINPQVSAPIIAGDIVGFCIYKYDGKELGKTNLLAARSVRKSIPAEIKQTVSKAGANSYQQLVIIALILIPMLYLFIRLLRKKFTRKTRYKW